jgi:hypothetical protein
MTGLIPIFLLSTVILILAVRLLARSWSGQPSRAVTADDHATARKALDLVSIETAAINRIFSTEDRKFVARTGTRDVQRLFLQERTALALQWLRKIQKQVAQLMDLHLRLASYTRDPSPRFELKLSLQYCTFMVVSDLVLLLLWLVGPFQAARVVAYTARAAGNVCTVFSLRLERTNPTQLGSRESLVH